ncbi:hypothetical protein ACX348_002608 [Enterococcus hirae]|nr:MULTISPECIES: hypothetical protein [Enterococcus]ELB25320.1 hypothetical protein OIW_03547 [Enterococcus faecium EnGen0040]RBS31527.1 hypothetical protein EB14_01888 [Enterococcus faecium]RBS86524.1 hypothetical protein EB59_02401 [Enterococcus faecium]RBS98178.1 hypothetical protein EB63_00432 [Enterococcus faecium]RBT44740.1 hypothetical protein EB07_00725 [Enterococcus hirae]
MFHVLYEFQFVEIVKEFFELPYKSDNSLSFDSAFQNCAKPEWNKIKNRKRNFTSVAKQEFDFFRITNSPEYVPANNKIFSEVGYIELLNKFMKYAITFDDVTIKKFFQYEEFSKDLISELVNFMMTQSKPYKLTNDAQFVLEKIESITDDNGIFKLGQIGWSPQKYLIPLLKKETETLSLMNISSILAELWSTKKIVPCPLDPTKIKEKEKEKEKVEKQEEENNHSNLYIEVNLDYPEDVPFPNGNYYTLYIKNKRNSLYYGEWDGLKHVAKEKKGIFKKVTGDLYQEIEKIRKSQEISEKSKTYIIVNKKNMSIIHSNIEFWSSFKNKIHTVKSKLSMTLSPNEIIHYRVSKTKNLNTLILPSNLWEWQLLSPEIDLDRHLFETETE